MNTVLLIMFGLNASSSSPGAKSIFSLTLPSLGGLRAVASKVKYTSAVKCTANCSKIDEIVYKLKIFGNGYPMYRTD